MNKLCCMPLSEPPEVNVKLNCISSCCASEMKSKDDISCSTAEETSHVKRSNKCCCGKKRKTFTSQAKEEVRNEKLKHE